jgi:uncharacterized protein YggE
MARIYVNDHTNVAGLEALHGKRCRQDDLIVFVDHDANLRQGMRGDQHRCSGMGVRASGSRLVGSLLEPHARCVRSLLTLLLCLPLFAWADAGLPTQPYIYVEGRAEVEKPADMVTLTFALSFLNLDLAAANKLVQAQANQVFALLKAAEVADKDVIASDLESAEERQEQDDTLPPRRGEVPGKRGKFLGYRVKRSFSVKVRDLARFPKLVDDLLAMKIFEFGGIQEGLSTEKDLHDEVWDKAVANARERADKTLKTTGAKLGAVFAISPVAFPQILPNIFGDSHQFDGLKSVPAGNQKIEPSQYRLAPVGVSQQVHVIYLIEAVK